MCSGAEVCLAYAREKLYNGKMDEKIRINKYLSEAGFCSRREADSLIQNGRVTVEGHKAEPGERITADTVVFVDGKPVKKVEEKSPPFFSQAPRCGVQHKKTAPGDHSYRVSELSGSNLSHRTS